MAVEIGVIGAGVMGADHVRLLSTAVRGSEVVAVADPDETRAKEVATRFGGRALADPLELIRSADVEAVLVASPDALHLTHVLTALEQGKPVLCEKPLAPTADEARQIVDAETEAVGDGDRLISVGFMRRFDPSIAALRDALTRGDIGRPLTAHAIHRNLKEAYPGGRSADTIRNSAIHELDELPWVLASPVVEVAWFAPAATSHAAKERQDPQILLVRTANGVLSTVEVFLNAQYGFDVRLELVGEEAALRSAETFGPEVAKSRTLSRGYAADWRPRFEDAYRLELQAWVDSVRTGVRHPDLATARDGLRANLVAEAAIRSLELGSGFVSVEQT